MVREPSECVGRLCYALIMRSVPHLLGCFLVGVLFIRAAKGHFAELLGHGVHNRELAGFGGRVLDNGGKGKEGEESDENGRNGGGGDEWRCGEVWWGVVW